MKATMILVSVNKQPTIIETEQEFEILYKLINCDTIEIISMLVAGNRINIICDEDGRLRDKPYNCLGIVGDFLISGPTKNGQFTSINNPEIIIKEVRNVSLQS